MMPDEKSLPVLPISPIPFVQHDALAAAGIPGELIGTVLEYRNLLVMYDCAIKVVQTKFDLINAEYKVRYKRNPIHSITTRLKKTSSIVEKLKRKGANVSVDSIESLLGDVAGVRVICSYLDDVYELAELISRQDGVRLIQQKDYISSPKRNGYRSLHLILSVLVSFGEEPKWMDVEVQIRTIAMDFWASLEHQLKYKQAVEDETQIMERLRVCADMIAKTDVDMLHIRQSIERCADRPTEDELLFERFRDVDISV